MRGRSHVFPTLAARAVGRLWLDRNPLRRTLDRVEAAIGAGLAIAFLASAPLAAIAAGNSASSVGSSAARSQQMARQQVPAVVLAPVPASGVNQNQVPARWVAPDGRQRTEHIPVPLGARAGAKVVVSADVAGRLTGPLQLRRPRDRAELASVLAFFTVAVIVLCVGHLANGALDRRRLTAWEADWVATEPKWTGRR